MQYTLFQNGRHFSILLFTCKLALVASFKGNILLNFEFKNEATRANLQVNKRKLKWRPFWNKVYICCRYCIYHVKFNVCLVTKPLGVFSSETKWLKRVSMGLTVRRKTAKNLAVRRKNERILAVSRKKN